MFLTELREFRILEFKLFTDCAQLDLHIRKGDDLGYQHDHDQTKSQGRHRRSPFLRASSKPAVSGQVRPRPQDHGRG